MTVYEIVDKWSREADKGNKESLYLLAGLYTHGQDDFPANPKKAIDLWWKLYRLTDASEKYGVSARYTLAFLLGDVGGKLGDNGMLVGCPPDLAQSIAMWKELAEQGFCDAQLKLARIYAGREEYYVVEADLKLSMKYAKECLNSTRITGIASQQRIESVHSKAQELVDWLLAVERTAADLRRMRNEREYKKTSSASPSEWLTALGCLIPIIIIILFLIF